MSLLFSCVLAVYPVIKSHQFVSWIVQQQLSHLSGLIRRG